MCPATLLIQLLTLLVDQIVDQIPHRTRQHTIASKIEIHPRGRSRVVPVVITCDFGGLFSLFELVGDSEKFQPDLRAQEAGEESTFFEVPILPLGRVLEFDAGPPIYGAPSTSIAMSNSATPLKPG